MLLIVGEVQTSQRVTAQINLTVEATLNWQANECPVIPKLNSEQLPAEHIKNILLNTGSPRFDNDTNNQTFLVILVNEEFTYKLPTILDPDGDDFKVEVDLSKAAVFSRFYSNKELKIVMTPAIEHVS